MRVAVSTLRPEPGRTRNAGTAAYVMEIGQPWPLSTCDHA